MLKAARVSLIDGGGDGGSRLAGVAVDLDDGWKTYWRKPGESGIPPEFKWEGSRNLGAIDVLYPLPTRFDDAGGDAIGYKHRVVFPLRLTAIDVTAPIELAGSLFLGVCKEVCVPLKQTVALSLPQRGVDQGVASWIAKVPRRAVTPLPVSAGRLVKGGGMLQLRLSLASEVDDIFVETDGDAYFHKPLFEAGEAVIAVDNVTAGKLAGSTLRLTVVTGGSGVEQSLPLA